MNKEMFSAYLYKAMSAIMAKENFDGFANWLDVRAREEYAHAMEFYDNILLAEKSTLRQSTDYLALANSKSQI